MRTILVFLLAVTGACAEEQPDPKAIAFCEEATDPDLICPSETSYERCLDLYAECGRGIVTTEVCPGQLSCEGSSTW